MNARYEFRVVSTGETMYDAIRGEHGTRQG